MCNNDTEITVLLHPSTLPAEQNSNEYPTHTIICLTKSSNIWKYRPFQHIKHVCNTLLIMKLSVFPAPDEQQNSGSDAARSGRMRLAPQTGLGL